jgi:hypothetical protein
MFSRGVQKVSCAQASRSGSQSFVVSSHDLALALILLWPLLTSGAAPDLKLLSSEAEDLSPSSGQIPPLTPTQMVPSIFQESLVNW